MRVEAGRLQDAGIGAEGRPGRCVGRDRLKAGGLRVVGPEARQALRDRWNRSTRGENAHLGEAQSQTTEPIRGRGQGRGRDGGRVMSSQ
ncbi:uncharacterized protein A4U43_C03F17470 [Asparagus officinalis]|uniref:Uncharacterized protein n=1 Tax=Asparagus officinalis TaxID=4686 RepID=A0A5P1FBE7_ASPOF|nr:uncharacterized protein A4U43_C03F17470 [Asparagus officinalis]